MITDSARNLTLAHAAIKHALYFLELEADTKAASYCSYAAEHLQNFASGLVTDSSAGNSSQSYERVLQAMQALADH